MGSDARTSIRDETMSRTLPLLAGIAGVLLFDVLVAARIWMHFPTNHWGYEVRWLYLPCAALLAFSMIVMLRERSPHLLSVTGTCLALVSSVGVFFVDHLNMLVQYEVWLRRGMPPFGS